MRRVGLFVLWHFCCLGSVLILLRMLWSVGSNPDKAFDIAEALDRAGNAATNGSQTETISSRANRARSEGRRWGCILCGLLDWIKKDHCRDSAGV